MTSVSLRGVAIAVVVAVAFAVGSCGGEAQTQPSQTFAVVGTEMAFAAPDSVSAGTYDVVFRNEGTTHHELALKGPDGAVVARRMVAAGRELTFGVDLVAGTWELGCFEPGHYEGGMHRTLVVTP
jgi:uncharacterized cupredoxin-like copper-binding protein